MDEVWKDVPDFEGFYQASNTGKIRSVDRSVFCKRGKGYKSLYKGRELKGTIDKDGYLKINLAKEGVKSTVYIHRIVAKTFLKQSKEKPVVNHINEIKDDNRVSNLEWCSVRYNNLYGGRSKIVAAKTYKPVKATHLKTGEELLFISMSSAKDKGFSTSNISQCCSGAKKTHLGYKWEYVKKENEYAN